MKREVPENTHTNALVQQASENQRRAANPSASVWVAASAGSGKTKVLTDRILRLLLTGVRPSKILALTFTNAAAAEMSNRVSAVLRDWSIMDNTGLDEALIDLLGRPASAQERETASRLFALVLETPGGMRIQTTHAFCQSLLGRFPIEARVPPNFELLDEHSARSLLEQARNDVLSCGFEDEKSDVATFLRILSRNLAENNFTTLIQQLLSERGRISTLFQFYGTVGAWVECLRNQLELQPGITSAQHRLAFCNVSDQRIANLKRLSAAIEKFGSKTLKDKRTTFVAWLELSPAERANALEPYLKVWLSNFDDPKNEGPAKRFINKDLGIKFPEAFNIFDNEIAHIERYLNKQRRLLLAEGNEALMRLLALMLERYQTLKAANAKLDYDDLILKSRDLLKDTIRTQWVLYKLDEGLSHILVDEAQDTNADQWDLITNLATEFFRTQTQDTPEPRTVFVVGDRKQSIYGFQRADPKVFDAKQDELKSLVKSAEGAWDPIALDISFRSVDAVLKLTDATLAPEPKRLGLVRDTEPWRPHAAKRQAKLGQVCLWPAIPFNKDEDVETADVKLAKMIAERIKVWTTSGDSIQNKVTPGDILILLQNRKPLAKPLVRELQLQGVPVAGLDRMMLVDQLIIQDLLNLADFVLLPEDDLALAALLRSPFCNLSDQDLFDLAHERGEASLWSVVRDRKHKHPSLASVFPFLQTALNLAETKPAFEFFSTILSAQNMRIALMKRLGVQIDDPIKEFLAKAIAYEQEGPSSLQGFVHWIRRNKTEIKRDAEGAQKNGLGEVRIMTAHGAKGLQAPVVILPDTMREHVNRTHTKALWQRPNQTTQNPNGVDEPWWIPNAIMARESFLEDLVAEQKQSDEEEKRRLLYVAMTRAEDSLHIMGHVHGTQSRKDTAEVKDGTWMNLVQDGFKALSLTYPSTVEDLYQDTQHVQIFRTGHEEEKRKKADANQDVEIDSADLEKLRAKVGDEPQPTRPLRPSQQDEEDLPVLPPSAAQSQGIDNKDQAHQNATTTRFQRGLVTHALLQHLPNLEPRDQEAAAQAFLNAQNPPLSDSKKQEIWQETLGVLNHSQAKLLFGPNSQAEVPLVGLVGKVAVSGRVDRLVDTGDEILIIDFKTNRPPPTDSTGVAKAYVRQMDLYAALLKEIYPDHAIRTFLLWTDGCHLMEVTS